MFPRKLSTGYDTRAPEKFVVQMARTDKLRLSAIPYMQRILNQQYLVFHVILTVVVCKQ